MIITATPKGNHGGAWRHLHELEKTTHLTKHFNTEKLVRGIPSSTEVIIFAGCWTPKYATISQMARSHGIKIGLLHCSPYGQTDICKETTSLKTMIDLLKFNKVDYLLTGDKKMQISLSEYLNTDKIKYLPQTMNPEFKINKKFTENLGLFCANMKNKNILNQIIAARITNRKLITNTFNRGDEEFANKINLNYENHGWLPKKEYYELIRKCGVGLQTSWSESFDYVAAEMNLMGIPVITSETVYWNIPSLKVKNADDPYIIADTIEHAFNKKLSNKVRNNILKELEKRRELAYEVLRVL